MLKPSNEGLFFTCHAFSADNQWLATGEMGGSIRCVSRCPIHDCAHWQDGRLWRTLDYTLIAEKKKILENPVECLRFIQNKNDSLIAVDTKGYYKCVKLPWSDDENQLDATSATEGDRSSLTPECDDRFQNNIPPPFPYSNICKHQFSGDGQILLRIQFKSTYFEPEYEIRAIEVINLRDSTPSVIQLDEDRKYRNGFPLLSKNGESVLMCSMSKTEVCKIASSVYVDILRRCGRSWISKLGTRNTR